MAVSASLWCRYSAAVVAAVAMAAAAPAAEPIEVQVDSAPAGAEVVQLKGFKRIPLGVTPLVRELDFRSSDSVLRLELSKPGFATETVQVHAGDPVINASLTREAVFRDPGSIDDPDLAAIQAEANRLLTPAFESVLEGLPGLSLQRPAEVVRYADRILLAIALEERAAGKHRDEPSRRAGVRIVEKMEAGLAAVDQLGGVVVSVAPGAGVGVTVGTRQVTEMACQGGMVTRMVWDACARVTTSTARTGYGGSVETKCVGGTVQRQVYDRCARHVPVTRSEVAFDNHVSVGGAANARKLLIGRLADGSIDIVGGCRLADGRPVDRWGDTGHGAYVLVCP